MRIFQSHSKQLISRSSVRHLDVKLEFRVVSLETVYEAIILCYCRLSYKRCMKL